ncbi:MAG: cell division protein SepF [Oscillospiraceae bacterium]
MNFFDNLKGILSQNSEDREYDEYTDEDYGYEGNVATQPEADDYGYKNDRYESEKAPIGIHRLPAGNLNIIQPTCVQDVIHDVVELLKNDSIVILNLTKIENGQRTRIVDFVSGVVAAIGGNLVEASPFTYTATPKSVSVSNENQSVAGVEGYMSGTSNS